MDVYMLVDITWYNYSIHGGSSGLYMFIPILISSHHGSWVLASPSHWCSGAKRGPWSTWSSPTHVAWHVGTARRKKQALGYYDINIVYLRKCSSSYNIL